MRHARRNGFPAPRVFDAEGPDILMERVEGPNLMDDALANPSLLRQHARLIAELLGTLADVRAPGWLPAVEGAPGTGLLHLDLHPLNVLITEEGPRVIDWANAARGAPGADLANTWLVMAAAPAPDAVAQQGRAAMLEEFLGHIDKDSARPYLPAMAERRRTDKNTLDAERADIDRIVAAETVDQVAG